MLDMTSSARRCARVLLAVVASGVAGAAASAEVTLLGVQYRQDNPYSEYLCLWHDRNYPTSCGADVVGANVHVYLRNDGASSVTVTDVTLAGYSLNKILRERVEGKHPPLHSIYYYWDNPPQDILDAGEPVWYKADPATIPPSGVAQVVVRLRFVPVTQPISLGIVTSAGTLSATIPVAADLPHLASVGFSPDLTRVYVHWRRSDGDAPTTILMDGSDVTQSATTVGDPTVNFGATVLQFAQPLSPMSYHVFQGVYDDGSKATGSIRAWVNPFVYGTWAARPTADGDFAAAKAWIDDAANRGVNALIMNISSGGLADYLGTSAGRQYAADRGYGFVIDAPGQWSSNNPRMWFIDDEPDAEESNTSCGTGYRPPCGGGHTMGILAMSFLERGEELRRHYPLAPTTINTDGAFKPTNYYTYGQVADVLMVDSYYQKRLSDTYWFDPQRIPLYEKATVIYATSLAVTTAAEPNPSHMLLYSNEYHDPNSSNVWPFPTPQSKRIEVYYALAGGSKGMGYWWFRPGRPPNGLGAGGPDANALWKEIGLLGNEIKTAAPLLVTSHPVALTAEGSDGVWVQSLAVGVDTLILLVVNDQYYNDQAGIHYTPISDATVTATLPAWLQSPTAFEIAAGGLSDVSTQLSGNQLQLNLGTLDLTRMIVVTTNTELKATLQQRYDQEVAPGVCAFAPEHCGTTPSITQQPTSVTVAMGDTVPFTVAATGGNLRYQWQKDGVNLSDGNGISGATSPMLQISDVQAGHAGGYRCVVSNRHGSVNSDTATLTVPTTDERILNSDFEGGFTLSGGGYVGNNWTEWESVSGVTTGYDETVTIHGGAHSQRIRVWNTGGASGGVYQRIPATPGRSYSVSVQMWAFDTLSSCSLGVDPAGGTNPQSGVTWSSPSNSVSWVQKTWTGTAASNAITVYFRAASGDSNKRNCYFDDATLVSGATPMPPTITQQPSALSVCPGGTAAFSVTATGEGTLSYQWQKNGVNVADGGHYSGATNPTLTVSPADGSDAASYRCVVTNAGGSSSSNEAALTLRAATIITQQPSNQTIAPGGTASLGVTATGDGPLSYRWQKNQVDLVDGGHYSGTTTAALTVSSADSNDQASYRCVVTAGCGSTTSNEVSLTVNPDSCHASVASDRWRGEYFANLTLSGTPSLVRDDGAGPLDFNWAKGGPGACGIGTDGFSARWTRTVSFASGTYRFTVTSDDGVRLYLDGALKLDKWFDQGPTTYTVDVALSAGNHTLTVEYYEKTGGAVAKLSWAPLTPPPTGQLRRYWVKPDWLSPNWGYQPRPAAPAPAVNRSGEISDSSYFRRAWLTEAWQWFWVDLLSLSKYQRVYSELTDDEKTFVTRAFSGLTGDHLAFTNNAGSSTKNCYPCGETDRGEDMKIDPLICGGNTVFGGDPVRNGHGEWMVKMYSFDANQPPPVATLDMLNDPRVLWATIISTNRLPDGSFHLFGFPQLKDGTPVPYPYMTVEEYYYPLEELEEYPLTDPKRPIYNP